MMDSVWLNIVKVAGGPALIFVLRYVAPGFVKKLPPAMQPIGAAIISVAIAVSTGADPVMALSTLVEAISVFFATMGAVKTIDIARGKSSTVTPKEKMALEDDDPE